MGTSLLLPDFKNFLRLNLKQVEYLLIGGYAVGYYGYSRATADMDIWIAFISKMPKKWWLSCVIWLYNGRFIRLHHLRVNKKQVAGSKI